MFSQLRSFIPSIYSPSSTSSRVITRNISLLSNIGPVPESQKTDKRVGRGAGSKLGKTSGRGQKGQKARGSVPDWFEGGQTPIYKLFPKRGFFRHQKLDLNEIPLIRIQKFYDSGKINLKDGEILTMSKMKEIGLITGTMKEGVSITGTGKYLYNLPISIEATKASGPAIEAIEKSGGKFTSKYYSKYLGYRIHHSPQWFLEKRGYLPIESKPIARRDILFYSNPERRGYLVDSEYVSQIQTKSEAANSNSKKIERKSELEKELELVSSKDKLILDDITKGASGFTNSKILSFDDLKKL